MLVTTCTQLKRDVRWSSQRLCRFLGVPYSSFRRWKQRLEHGQPVRRRPGPKKVVSLTLEELRGDLAHLHHGRERSRGAGGLYRQYRTQISRRELAALLEAARRTLARQRQADLRHVTWHVPGLVWSLDDTELTRLPQRLHLHQVQDVASRYKFTPWVGQRLAGDAVARRLEQLFVQHGAPLVLKRDNGGNLNDHAVDEVLARYLVMPLNSPPEYPRYNGGMEHAIRELKEALAEKLLAGGPLLEAQLQSWAELLAHDLNHRSRRCLEGEDACKMFQGARAALRIYPLRRRREFFDEINDMTETLMQAGSVFTQRRADTARRLAVEAWLQRRGVITITQHTKVLPIFLKQLTHY